MKKYLKVISVVLVFVLAIALFAGCQSKPADTKEPDAAQGNAVERIKKAGKITMLTNAGFPPYEFLGEDNSVVGVDVEIARAIAEELGVELEVVDMDFDAIVFAIQSGKGDLGVAGMTNNAERRENVDFSINYVDTYQMIIVKEGSEIKSVDDLAGKVIGVQMGTTGDIFVSDEIEGADVQRYKTAPDAGAELVSGKLDAVVVDAGPAAQIAAANKGLVVLDDPATAEPEQYAIAIAKGNDDLKAVVDTVLARLIADDSITNWYNEYSEMSAGE